MSISSSLNAGVMGLNVNAARLSTISDNIANSSTAGYKRSQVDFSSMVLQQRSSSYSAGGVRVDTFKDIATTGSLVSTGSATDIAVAGRGLFPVTDESGLNASQHQPARLILGSTCRPMPQSQARQRAIIICQSNISTTSAGRTR